MLACARRACSRLPPVTFVQTGCVTLAFLAFQAALIAQQALEVQRVERSCVQLRDKPVLLRPVAQSYYAASVLAMAYLVLRAGIGGLPSYAARAVRGELPAVACVLLPAALLPLDADMAPVATANLTGLVYVVAGNFLVRRVTEAADVGLLPREAAEGRWRAVTLLGGLLTHAAWYPFSAFFERQCGHDDLAAYLVWVRTATFTYRLVWVARCLYTVHRLGRGDYFLTFLPRVEAIYRGTCRCGPGGGGGGDADGRALAAPVARGSSAVSLEAVSRSQPE